jgi:preprotein translocase subunit YajC
MHMYRKIAVAGVTAAAILGVGTAAMAASGSSGTSGSGSRASHQKGHHQRPAKTLRHGLHGELVTKSKDGYVVHSGIRGTVTSVSATAITVKAADGYSQTLSLSKQTKVRERPASGKGKGTKGTVADLKSGDKVAVIGKKLEKASGAAAAKFVVDGLRK